MMLNAFKKLNQVRTGKHPVALAISATSFSMARTCQQNGEGGSAGWFEE